MTAPLRQVYLNGQFVPEAEAKISIYDSALMFGDMVFEMTRSFNKKQFKLREHLERLYASIKYVRIPLKMTIEEAKAETLNAWARSYSPERNFEAIRSISTSPIEVRIGHIVARLFFRGIYFPQMSKGAWLKLLYNNRRTILGLAGEGITTWRRARKRHRREARLTVDLGNSSARETVD